MASSRSQNKIIPHTNYVTKKSQYSEITKLILLKIIKFNIHKFHRDVIIHMYVDDIYLFQKK